MTRTVVHFHIGRGGRFHNPGYKTFVGVEDMHPSESSIVFEQDEDCNDEEVELIKTAIIKEDVSSFRLTDDDKDYILNF